MSKTKDFLRRNKLFGSDIDLDQYVRAFHEEMTLGLEGKESSLEMIPTYIEADNEFLKDTPVLAIDAGGTNFRAAVITFHEDGDTEIGEIHHHPMPGVDKEISAAEFFETMAGYIEPLVDKTDKIGFCFSYATEISADKDGKLLHFTKEVKAPEVVGKMIGKSLLEVLKRPEKEIVLLNDTVATLLAGKSASIGKTYDSYVGFILGTGSNISYIEKNSNILKMSDLDPERSQIINTESGNFARTQRTALDLQFDNSTTSPGIGILEKMFSGGYFGNLCLTVLKAAADENLFTEEVAGSLLKIQSLSSEDANDFVSKRNTEKSVLNGCFSSETDAEAATLIIDTLIDRASALVAGTLAAIVLKTGKGKRADSPVLITIEGTTFYKLHKLKERFETYFFNYLTGDKKRYVDFIEVEKSSLIGAALAGLIE
ncbi:MAG: hypothetical protein JJU37_00705 [Balneolaceae bacterium]|nr:hypothetical protein [Balneolaceae bacterium]